ncbi:MAG TPA: hypothetical protein EYQ85_02485 [Candidatus Poseidoniales archaeon]|nr:hypothetical protein [Candidatus Poseidoniales archaeon]
MRKHTPLMVMMLYLGSMMVAMAPLPVVDAQSPTPMITLTCNSLTIEIDVAPGKDRSGSTMCSIQNPTAYDEQVRVDIISTPGIAVAAPGSLAIGAGRSADFPIGILAPSKAEMKDHSVTVRASVTHINGVSSPQNSEQSTNMIVSIKQFAMMQIVAQNSFTQLKQKVDYTFVFDVYNHGNFEDKFRFAVIDQNPDDTLADKGFQVTLPAVSMVMAATDTPYKAKVNVRTPKIQGWTDEYYQLQFSAMSDFTCKEDKDNCELDAESQIITIYVRGVYLPGFEIIPTLSMIALAAAVIGRRYLNTDEEEESSMGLF